MKSPPGSGVLVVEDLDGNECGAKEIQLKVFRARFSWYQHIKNSPKISHS